jgi:hypothetical protein
MTDAADRSQAGPCSPASLWPTDRPALLADPAGRLAFGARSGARSQTAGHGRGEKFWLSEPRASLLASWIFRPAPAEPALFTTRA